IEHALRDFDDVAAAEGPRASAIIDHRMIGGRTLGELGDYFGITRERVRQIETVVKRRLGDMGMGVRLLKSAVAARFGPVRRISDVRALMPELDSTPTSSVSPLWELLAISQVPTLGDGDVAEGRPDDWR
ncbi:sigma factor-like helix-turn-helix DNA-binding protein, partial [Acinetobacter baumannii]|uniref:sigma factor-like helix-turn-helix DNA-binding protein n=1 Tax=Acinetobacter baumannii TaxID=470 RepID=UPI001DCC012C